MAIQVSKSITTQDIAEFNAAVAKLMAKKGVRMISLNGHVTKSEAGQEARFNISWEEDETL